MTVLRLDAGTIRSFKRTPQGGLRVVANLAKTGCLRYRDTTGKEWVEYRAPEVTFAADALESLRGAPVTDGHPAEQLVTTENYARHARGHVADDVRAEPPYVVGTLVINDAALVHAIEAGARADVSIGYHTVVDWTPGAAPDGTRYDARQAVLRGNHTAVLPPGAGRAGPDVALRLDGAAVQVEAVRTDAAATDPAAPTPAATKETPMRVLTIKGRAYRLDAEGDVAAAQAAVDQTVAEGDSLLAQIKASNEALQKALQEALAKAADSAAKLTALEAQQAAQPNAQDQATALDARVLAREKLRADARKVLGAAAAPDKDGKDPLFGKSERQIRELVVATQLKDTRLDALSEDAITGAFLAIVAATPEPKTDALSQVRRAAEAPAGGAGTGGPVPRQDAADEDPRDRMKRRTSERWKQPTTLSASARKGS